MAESRVSNIAVEVLSTGATPNARTSTVAIEVLHSLTEQLSGTGGQKPVVVVVAGYWAPIFRMRPVRPE